MAKKQTREEVTVESLAQAIQEKGLVAAEKLLQKQKDEVEKECQEAQEQLSKAEQMLEESRKKMRILETLMQGAIKKASQEAGYRLDEPAEKKPKPKQKQEGKRSRRTKEESQQQRDALFKAIKEHPGLGRAELMEAAGYEQPSHFSGDIKALKDAGEVIAEGSKINATYKPA